MSFLKFTGKFLGGLLVLLGLTIFTMTYFGNYAINHVDLIEEGLSVNEEVVDFVEDNQEEIEMTKLYCEQNIEDENCKMLGDPAMLALFEGNVLNSNPILESINQEVSEFRVYGSMMRLFGIVFFFLGLVFFILSEGWLIGIRNASLLSFIGSVISYLYFRYALPGTLISFVPEELMGILGNWITASLNHTLNMIFILGVTFLILTISLYILNNKLKKEVIEK